MLCICTLGPVDTYNHLVLNALYDKSFQTEFVNLCQQGGGNLATSNIGDVQTRIMFAKGF